MNGNEDDRGTSDSFIRDIDERADVAIHDIGRLAAVRSTGLLDSVPEPAFDRLTRLAVRLTGVPAAFFSLVDETRDFYKSECGFGEPLASTRELTGLTFCHYAIQSTKPLVIPDTAADPIYSKVPTVRTLGVAAYVGVPLVVDAQVIGSFCVIDTAPHAWTTAEVEVLTELAASAEREISLRAAVKKSEAYAEQLLDQSAELESQQTELEAQMEDARLLTARLEQMLLDSESARLALLSSEKRKRAMTESVPVQVWTALPDGRLDFVSDQTAKYFGVTPAQLLGTGWGEYVHAEDIDSAIDRWGYAVQTGIPYQTEFRLRSGQLGEYRWHLARAVPEHDEGGVITGWVGSNTDVHAERVARSDAEQARKSAEHANRAKADFLAQMSHELRTPLNAISGYAELISMGIRGPVTTEQLADLERIQASQRHLQGLINGVLNFAKLETGTVRYETTNLSLAEALSVCEALTAPQMRTRKLRFAFERPDAKIYVRADLEKLRQVILNLLTNAMKFTDAGGSITLSCSVGTTHASICVSDSGRGIPSSRLQQIFEPFVQVDSHLTNSNDGIGLGLAISRDLARAMNGDLTVKSELGIGSMFTVMIPLAAPFDS